MALINRFMVNAKKTTLVKQHIVIISPALANANNGNWQTASRWARMLRCRYRVTILSVSDAPPALKPDVIIALHARRSAGALAALLARYPGTPTIVVLTGTDLYRDIRSDAAAQGALEEATRLVVLQEAGIEELSPALQAKTHVIHQSAPTLKAIGAACKSRMRYFDVCMIGHLREEKDPATFMQAAKQIAHTRIRLTHIGGALDPALALLAQKTQETHTNYRWLGELPHADTRHRLKRCHLMVIASKMEGGANVIIEALTSGVPVLASDISGNRGMLGKDYAGYFPLGDSLALARLIERSASDAAFYAQLHGQCGERAPLFSPAREQAALLQLVDNSCLPRNSNRMTPS
jgi:putative glycosyltransferase (TIGR04348 family)